MAKKRGKRGSVEEDAERWVPPPERFGGQLKSALSHVTIASPEKKRADAAPTKTDARPAQPVSRSTPPGKGAKTLSKAEREDRQAFTMAFSGVKPLAKSPHRVTTAEDATRHVATAREKAAPVDTAAEDEARARLDALVAGNVKIRVWRNEDGFVRAVRLGGDERIVRTLERGEAAPEATLDLHGLRSSEAAAAITQFVRREHKRGARTVLVIHGRGSHSDAGVGVLDDVAIRALAEGGATPFVAAFATAPTKLGGVGAVVVKLVEKLI